MEKHQVILNFSFDVIIIKFLNQHDKILICLLISIY